MTEVVAGSVSGAEQEFLDLVADALVGRPALQRSDLLAIARDHLEERPPAASVEELVESLGTPEAYATELVELADQIAPATPVGIGERLRLLSARHRILGSVVALAVVAAVAAGWWYHAYVTTTPRIINPCGGVMAADVEWREAVIVREAVVSWHPGERIGLFLCPSGDLGDRVVVDSIHLVGLDPSSLSPIRPVGVEVKPSDLAAFTGDVTSFEPFRLDERGSQLVLWFEFDWCWPAGISYDTVEIGYRYRGRDRAMRMPLNGVLTVSGPETCADARAQEAQIEQWPRALFDAVGVGPVEPYEPLNIGRDLCRYLDGVRSVPESAVPGRLVPGADEPLSARAVYRIDDADLRTAIIDTALDLVCPHHVGRRAELLALAPG